jgi:hypothetical protein
MGTKLYRQRQGRGWTWEFKPVGSEEYHLCHWVLPTKAALLYEKDSMPSDDARPVQVELVPVSARIRKRYGYV